MQRGTRHLRKKEGDQEIFKVKHRRHQENGEWRWFYTLMVIGWFAGLFIGLSFYEFAVLNWWNLTKIFLICPIIFLLIPYKITHRKWGMYFSEWLGFCLLGAGPFLGVLYLVFALVFSSPEVERRELIVSKERVDYAVVLQFESEFLDDQPRFRTLDLNYFPAREVEKAQVVIYQYREGFLGIDFIMDYSLE